VSIVCGVIDDDLIILKQLINCVFNIKHKFQYNMEFLPDPVNDRPLKDLPPFVNKALDDSLLFPRNSEGVEVPDWKILEEFMQKEGPLIKAQVMKIIAMGTDIFKNEPNLVKIPEPVVVVGDIHGQYYDLVHMLNKAGDP
jgi:serine/threonine-protein phosphatase 2B catalytic subunit